MPSVLLSIREEYSHFIDNFRHCNIIIIDTFTKFKKNKPYLYVKFFSNLCTIHEIQDALIYKMELAKISQFVIDYNMNRWNCNENN